jgi:hypothetical protein
MYAAIPELVAQGLTRGEIAERYGVSTNCLQVLCSRHGVSLRNATPKERKPRRRRMRNIVHVTVSYPVLVALQDAARMYGRANPETLAADLLERISADRLFMAVLDEDAHSKPTQLEAY